jgi:hypothetical protein
MDTSVCCSNCTGLKFANLGQTELKNGLKHFKPCLMNSLLLNRNKNVVIPGRLKAEPGIQQAIEQPIENTGFRITATRFPE